VKGSLEGLNGRVRGERSDGTLKRKERRIFRPGSGEGSEIK
jgi:hypothetical protein